MGEVLIEQGDLTTYDVDAIVNAANNDLILGGGVAGAIARRGGPTIQQECNALGPIRVGEAAITSGGKLPARYVIHAASMHLGGRTTADNLARSVRAALVIAEERGLRTIAFPAIGTGIAGFDIEECAKIMIPMFLEHVKKSKIPEKIILVLWDPAAYNVCQRVYEWASSDDKKALIF